MKKRFDRCQEWFRSLFSLKNRFDADVFSPGVTFFEVLIFFDLCAISVLNTRCEGNSKDEEVLKRQFYFS